MFDFCWFFVFDRSALSCVAPCRSVTNWSRLHCYVAQRLFYGYNFTDESAPKLTAVFVQRDELDAWVTVYAVRKSRYWIQKVSSRDRRYSRAQTLFLHIGVADSLSLRRELYSLGSLYEIFIDDVQVATDLLSYCVVFSLKGGFCPLGRMLSLTSRITQHVFDRCVEVSID